MASVVGYFRRRPRLDGYVRLVYDVHDQTNVVTNMALEQSGFDDYDFTVLLQFLKGDARGEGEKLKQRGGRLVLPAEDLGLTYRSLRGNERPPTIPGKSPITRIPDFGVGLRITVDRSLRGRADRILWLAEQAAKLKERALRTGSDRAWRAAQHAELLHLRNVQGPPLQMMADYESGAYVETWASDNGDPPITGNITLPSAANVAVMGDGGYDYSGGPWSPTLESNAPDDIVDPSAVTGMGSQIAAWGNPTTGSSIAYSNGVSAGSNESAGVLYGVSSADGDEIAATGYPSSGSDTAADPSIVLTTDTDDLAVDVYASYGGGGTGTPTVGGGQTEIYNQPTLNFDVDSCNSYEKATGASVTMTWTGGDAWSNHSAAVIPTAEGVSATVAPGKVALKGISPARVTAIDITQTRYRLYADDDVEGSATALAAENTSASVSPDTNVRVRNQLDAVGDPPTATRTWQYREEGGDDDDWVEIPVE